MTTRGLLSEPDYRPLFSGHETFPLRYGWLKKAYDAVVEDARAQEGRSVFASDSAIARFGVGKNMVGSMRHWALHAGVIGEDRETGRFVPTPIGDFLFGKEGVDPYLEDSASLWYLHWLLCSGERGPQIKTTWYWVFNHLTSPHFRREELVDSLMRLVETKGWQRVARTTVQRDVECFVRTYEARQSGGRGTVEDHLESPLAELGLLRGFKGTFQLVRGPKPSLPNGMFAIALEAFWNRRGPTTTLAFEALTHESGSPGRVFLLDEADLANRLLRLEDTTRGSLRWSETAGLRQVLRSRPLGVDAAFALLNKDYRVAPSRRRHS
jgi:hypothetical protein